MKHLSKISIAILFVAVSLSAQTTYTLDPAHAYVDFSVKHMMFNDVRGKFSVDSGKVVAAKEDFSDAQIDVWIKTASVNTSNEKRDAHLKSGDFFDAEKNPSIIFKSSSMKKIGADTYTIAGNLTMRGVTKPVTLDAKLKGKAKSPWGNTVVAFQATASIDRTQWGVSWNKPLEAAGGLLVGNTVDLTFNVELN